MENNVRTKKTTAQQTYKISTSPSLIGPRVHHPQLSQGVAAPSLWPIDATILVAEKVVGRGEPIIGNVNSLGGVHVGEKAVVEKAALEDEVAEGIGHVPDEEEAQRAGG